MEAIRYEYDDGGRGDHFAGEARDCVCRAVAIATEIPYMAVYERLADGTANQRASRRTPKQARSARNGIYTKRKWFRDYMAELGFVWLPTMHVGSGCTVHLCAEELPSSGRLVVKLSRHLSAVIDGVVRDTHDPSRDGTRCVYGYWRLGD